jgi:multiple antibiotic resistance protein
LSGLTQTFLLSLSALFSIVNPIGGAIMFSQMTASLAHRERTLLARRIAAYSAILMIVVLWTGSWLLEFFGIGLPALRIGGGLVVMSSAWSLLQSPDSHEGQDEAPRGAVADDMAFFPLTMPLTTGPGTIAVTVALASSVPSAQPDHFWAQLAISAAALAIAAFVGIAYSLADRVTALLGAARANILSRLAAFVLLCVGVQIVLAGIEGFVAAMPVK